MEIPKGKEVQSLPLQVSTPRSGYIIEEMGRVDLDIEGEQLEAFRCLHQGMIDSKAVDHRGHPMTSKADVIRWFLDSLAKKIKKIPKNAKPGGTGRKKNSS